MNIQSTFADSIIVDYFSEENILKFARMLYSEKDYLRSAGEYQRYLAINKTSADSALFKIALCYERSNLREKSISFYEKIINRYPHSPLLGFSYYQISANFHLLKNYENSNTFIQKVFPLITQSFLIEDFLYLKGINFIYQKKWKRAELYFKKELEKNHSQDFKKNLLYAINFTQGRFEIFRKKPFLAGLLSTLVPGSGKIYCGKTGDGFYSLIINALTGYLAWAGFHENGINSIQGWTFGTIGGIFYIGNIYGSVKAAQIFNNKQIEDYLNGFNPQFRLYNEINF
jgi:tetratricopeptide (TPR) repeat protein